MQIVRLTPQRLDHVQGIDVLAQRCEDQVIGGGAWVGEPEGPGEVAGAEAGGYAEGEDAGVPEVGPADAGLEGEREGGGL